jgi:hypothetical protein
MLYQYKKCILFATNKILDPIDKFAKQIPYNTVKEGYIIIIESKNNVKYRHLLN